MSNAELPDETYFDAGVQTVALTAQAADQLEGVLSGSDAAAKKSALFAFGDLLEAEVLLQEVTDPDTFAAMKQVAEASRQGDTQGETND